MDHYPRPLAAGGSDNAKVPKSRYLPEKKWMYSATFSQVDAKNFIQEDKKNTNSIIAKKYQKDASDVC